MFLSGWREFPSAPCLAGKKLDDSSRLDVVEIARVPDMLPSFFSFLVGAKDLSAPQYKQLFYFINRGEYIFCVSVKRNKK